MDGADNSLLESCVARIVPTILYESGRKLSNECDKVEKHETLQLFLQR